MNKRRFIGLIVLLAAGLLLPATPVLAGDGPPGDDGIVIWNEDYTLEEGERLEGDLIVFNGDATLEADSRVEGSVIVWNGNADVKGTVEGELVVSSGDIYLSEDAWVQGSVVCSWSCELEQEEGARVDGGITEGTPLPGLPFEQWRVFSWTPPTPSLRDLWDFGPGVALRWTIRVIRGAVSVLVVATIAGLVALIWPNQTAQVGQAIVKTPGPSLGVGLLTAIGATVLIIGLAITICLSPIAILAGLVLLAAGLFGWISIGALVGKRLLQAFKAREIAPIWAAGLGTLVVTLVTALMDAVPCINVLGWLVVFVMGCAGLGAVILTRFGTTAYTSTYSTPAPTPVEAPESPEPVEQETENN